jgi:membrane protease YdiL (CAAX protease family)
MPIDQIRAVATNVALPHPEWPSVVRRRRVIVCVVLVAGASLLAYSLNRRPGDAAFYWLTLSLAAVWALGAVLSGPLHLGSINWRGRNQRPVLTGSAVGLLLGAAFLVGGLVISTLLYAVATSASGNPMLGFAALVLGTVCALQRRATGGVLAPVLTHVVWGLIMVLALPPIFGL